MTAPLRCYWILLVTNNPAVGRKNFSFSCLNDYIAKLGGLHTSNGFGLHTVGEQTH